MTRADYSVGRRRDLAPFICCRPLAIVRPRYGFSDCQFAACQSTDNVDDVAQLDSESTPLSQLCNFVLSP